MSATLLEVNHLKSIIKGTEVDYHVVDDVSFSINRGQTLALLGESGCGKSMTALSIMGLLPKPVGQIKSGQILLESEDLLGCSEQQLRHIRGKRIGMIFQEPMTSLNPVMTVGEQIAEVIRFHLGISGKQLKNRVIDLLQTVRIPDAAQRMLDYPHQLSGGMKQRVMIALALAVEPDLLIADEPTTALDVTIQAQVLTLIKSLQKKNDMAILLITHDLGIVSQMADQVAVMYAGQLVEYGDASDFFSAPKHPYTRALFAALPTMDKRRHQLRVIQGQVPQLNQHFNSCRFLDRCDHAVAACSQSEITLEKQGNTLLRCINPDDKNSATEQQNQFVKVDSGGILLQADRLKVHFPIRKGLLKRTVAFVYAVDGVNLTLKRGKTLALVGESGCGKTTVGKALLQLINPTSGSVVFDQQELCGLNQSQLKPYRARLQFIFQDPFSSMNPRMLVADILSEGMQAQGLKSSARDLRLIELLEQVGLDRTALNRYPHEFSGGQRQRIAIARALAVNPEFIVCDEPTSALDVSVQAQILNLLRSLQQKMQLSYLFITHNIAVVSYIADEIAVMYLGRIVEQGSVAEILQQAKHPYTQSLLAAVPEIETDSQGFNAEIKGELPSAINPPDGCFFHPRCEHVMDICKTQYPKEYSDKGHKVSCFLFHQQHESVA